MGQSYADWRTPDVDNAVRAFDAAADRAFGAIRLADEKLAQAKQVFRPATDEDVERFRAWVTGAGRTPEWEAIAARVEAGEITWRAIVDGELDTDPGLMAAMRSMRHGLTAADFAAGTAAPQAPSHPRPAPPPDDDDYFDDFSAYR